MRKTFLFCLIAAAINVSAQQTDSIDLKSLFGNFTGGFCVYDLNTGKTVQYRPDHCKKRFSPCSTFKIPNSLIGLETGVIPDTAFVIPYDSIQHPGIPYMKTTEPFKYWFQDLSLKRALRYSCVWYYKELAHRVGQKRMEKYVKLLDYGNKDISSGLEQFWLCGSMQISINEQIEFLKKLYLHQLNGISDKSIDAVKSIMLNETTSDYTLYGKTGGGSCSDNKVIGWYVGFVETGTGTKIFAMNVLVSNFSDIKDNFRIELTKKALRELKIIK